jgi:peptidoglycan/xylan/chitin deacetylase (PgdA/CDA1 family)
MDFVFNTFTRHYLVAIAIMTMVVLAAVTSFGSFSSVRPNQDKAFLFFTYNQASAKKIKVPSVPLVVPKHKAAASIHSTSSHHRHSASPTSSATSVPSSITTNGAINGNNGTRLVIINFDDSFKNQFLYAKPILDKYGFKATFFEVCGWIGKSSERKSWQDIAALQQDGMDIESHTMTHPNLNTLTPVPGALDYQIGGAKQCFLNHGINTPIFAYPYSQGWDNPAVVNTVAKYYNLARTDTGFPVTFLHCDGWKTHPQTDCRTYSGSGGNAGLTFANRYSIKSWTHRHIDGPYSSSQEGSVCAGVCHSYDNSQMLQIFISDVNTQLKFNQGGIVRAIPIIIYHNLVTYPDVSLSKDAADTTVNLFDEEMKYLHDNGFRVLTMNQLGYDPANNVLYIKNQATQG